MPSSTAQLEWEHWKKLDEWQFDIFVCLMQRVNPASEFGSLLISNGPHSNRFSDTQEHAWAEAAKLRQLVWASHKKKKLGLLTPYSGLGDPPDLAPSEWLAWAKSKNLQIPPELEDLVPASSFVAVQDWNRWTVTRELWTLVEASYLLSNFEPIDSAEVRNDGSSPSNLYRLLKDSVLAGTLLALHAPSNLIGHSRVRPHECVVWAERKGLTVPPELRQLTPMPKLDLHPKEKSSLLTLVIAMAIKGYRYNPRERGNIVRELVADASECGLSINEDTVRKWLDAAGELVEQTTLDRLFTAPKKRT